MSEITGSDPGEQIAQEIYASGEASGEKFSVQESVVLQNAINTEVKFEHDMEMCRKNIHEAVKYMRSEASSIRFWAEHAMTQMDILEDLYEQREKSHARRQS